MPELGRCAENMNQQKRLALINRAKEIGLPDDSGLPLVSLEDFFEGNDDLGSIGCNLIDHPGVEFFYDQLKAIRAKENVSSVLVALHEVEEADDSMWPFADTVYVTTSEDPAIVFDWFVPLQADSIGPDLTGVKNPPEIPEGHDVCVAWWD